MARHATVAALLLIAQLSSCGEEAPVVAPAPAAPATVPPPPKRTLHLGVLSALNEAFEKRVLPEFRASWAKSHGEEVAFEVAYEGSHEIARAILGGSAADVAVVSNSTALDELAEAGLMRGRCAARPHRGVFSRSAIVLAVRKGNPEGIRDWADLQRPGIDVLLPDPSKSATGRSAICAIHRAAFRGYAGVDPGIPDVAEGFLAGILANVLPPDPSTRDSFKRFESGVGDVAITAESEVIRGRIFGHEYERVIPRSTLLMEYVAAVVDANAEQHGSRDLAKAFVEFLRTAPAQSALAFYGIRPIDEALAARHAAQYPMPEDLWTIDEIGGWERIQAEYFGEEGILERAARSVLHDK